MRTVQYGRCMYGMYGIAFSLGLLVSIQQEGMHVYCRLCIAHTRPYAFIYATNLIDRGYAPLLRRSSYE
jgi:hypothetical protein